MWAGTIIAEEASASVHKPRWSFQWLIVMLLVIDSEATNQPFHQEDAIPSA